jgi:hypothetical protein
MTRYPLTWPDGWKRTQCRQSARFNQKRTKYHQDVHDKTKTVASRSTESVTISEATQRVLKQLHAFGVEEGDSIISTNLIVRLDGLPRSDQKEPDDPGVAIYWKMGNDPQHKVMAIDLYDRAADNLAAIAATLDAMRAIERHGGALILERAFTGFIALPSPNDWRHVLGFEKTPSFDEAKDRFRKLAIQNHSDTGGSDTRMAELNGAWEAAQRELL